MTREREKATNYISRGVAGTGSDMGGRTEPTKGGAVAGCRETGMECESCDSIPRPPLLIA